MMFNSGQIRAAIVAAVNAALIVVTFTHLSSTHAQDLLPVLGPVPSVTPMQDPSAATPAPDAAATPAPSATPRSPWAHESEVSVVKVTGNTNSDSYSAKQKTSYKFDSSTAVVSGRYLQSTALGKETGRQWDATLRLEHELSPIWTVFIQHGSEGAPYSGFIQRDNTDLGGKYFLLKTPIETFLAEAGLRSSQTNWQGSKGPSGAISSRLYVEYSRQINASVSGRLWIEYLPNFTDKDEYFVNFEPSMTVMMDHRFSLKIAYLSKYHNKTQIAGESKDDATFTTSLVGKF